MIQAILWVAVANLIPLGFVAFHLGHTALGLFDLSVGLVLGALLIVVRRTSRYRASAYVGISLAGTLFVYLFVTGGIAGTGHVWYYTFPLFASFLLGARKGMIASLLLILPALLVLTADLGGFVRTYEYPPEFAVRFLSSWLVVLLYSFVFEYLRASTQRDLIARNEDLGEAVSALQGKEAALANARDRLDVRVRERTADLRQANVDLQAEIRTRCEAEEGLRLAHDRFVTVLDSIDAAVYAADLDTHEVLFANHSMRQAFGEDVVGRRCHAAIQQSDLPCADCTNPHLRDEEGRPSGESSWEALNPVTHRWSLNRARAVRWVDGRVVRIQVSSDLTERKAAEEENRRLQSELLQAQRMEAIGTLAGGVAHDLNNILGGVVGYPDVLLMDLPENHAMRPHLEAIRDAGERCALTVKDLLALARRRPSSREPLALVEIVRGFFGSPEFSKIRSRHRGVRMELITPAHLPRVRGSAHQVSKALMNLVVNACESMPDGGRLRVSCNTRRTDAPIYGYQTVPVGEYVALNVSDTGLGISRENVRRIFEPFFSTKVLGHSGTGLGMAVVWAAVKDHGGFIDVQSTEGVGTEMTLYFPLAIAGEEAAAVDRIPVDYRGAGESVLVVDDDEHQRELAEMILRKLGYDVAAVESGEAALDWLSSHQPDLLLLDMVMEPGIDGLETWQCAARRQPGLRAVMVTGFAETERVELALRGGIGTCVQKPYFVRDLGRAVRTELDRASH